MACFDMHATSSESCNSSAIANINRILMQAISVMSSYY